MSQFLSFEPLIIPVYARCFCCLALDDILITTLLLTLTRSRMTTLQEDQEEEEEVKHKCLVSNLVRTHTLL